MQTTYRVIFENKKTAFEIAQVLGITIGNVRKKKHDCKTNLLFNEFK